jgi:hypothetical protein
MEYDLVKAEGYNTEMVRWSAKASRHKIDLLEQEVGLSDLGSLAEAPQEELLTWLSKYGLLGFRPPRELSHPDLLHMIILGANRVHGQGNRLYFAYEPLYLVKEGARVARAASALYAAIRITESKKRMLELAKIIQMNHETATGYGKPDDGVVNREIEMKVLEVPIGFHIQPKTPVEWTNVAISGLSNLTDHYLSSEFSLSWMEPTVPSRNIKSGWKVRSLLGAMFFKMAHQLSTRRYCRLCNKPLSSQARSDAQVCGPTCRKRLNRERRTMAGRNRAERRVP